MLTLKGYLYVADENGEEIPGSQRSLAHVRRGDGQYRVIENELKRMAADGCTVRYSEAERRWHSMGPWAIVVFFWGSLAGRMAGLF